MSKFNFEIYRDTQLYENGDWIIRYSLWDGSSHSIYLYGLNDMRKYRCNFNLSFYTL